VFRLLTPNHWAGPRVIVMPYPLFVARGRKPDKGPFRSDRK
jgi:hypothetical protein